jgi:hypothetical protein
MGRLLLLGDLELPLSMLRVLQLSLQIQPILPLLLLVGYKLITTSGSLVELLRLQIPLQVQTPSMILKMMELRHTHYFLQSQLHKLLLLLMSAVLAGEEVLELF